MRIAPAFILRHLRPRAAAYPSADRLGGRRTLVAPLWHEVDAWCGRLLTNRWVLGTVIAATLAVATLSCLVGPRHPVSMTPCYWEIAQLPGRLVLEALWAVARTIARVAAELNL